MSRAGDRVAARARMPKAEIDVPRNITIPLTDPFTTPSLRSDPENEMAIICDACGWATMLPPLRWKPREELIYLAIAFQEARHYGGLPVKEFVRSKNDK